MPQILFPQTEPAESGCGRAQVALACLILWLAASVGAARAETGYEGWLRYERLGEKTATEQYGSLPAVVVSLGDTPPVQSAREELIRGVRGMLGRTLRAAPELPKETSIVLGTYDAVQQAIPGIGKLPQLAGDGFWLRTVEVGGTNHLVITAPTDRGVLYGTFVLLRKIALAQSISPINERQVPYAALRIVNQWDQRDGTVENGYGGRSIFWEDSRLVKDLSRAGDYARLLASVGINGLSINRGESASRVLAADVVQDLARVAGVLRPWGVRLYVALDSPSAPTELGRARGRSSGGEGSSWESKVAEIYAAIPDFGGFVLDAELDGLEDAEQSAARHVAATAAIAEALKPHGGLLFYRCHLTDADVDERDPKADPARAVFDQLHGLDGKLGDNVVLQIKNGPVDFQVREAPSPLVGALARTNQALELQITQQYTGQHRHLCYLVPMWKWILDFDLHAKSDATPIHALVSGKSFERPTGGLVGVANVGRGDNWLGHELAMANLYGFGRLAWDPSLAPKQVADEWTRLTFGSDPLVVGTIVDMLLKSWRMYENYTGPLGMGTLTDLSETHYGPAIEPAGAGAWRGWHSADERGVGKDRTAEEGTGFVSQYAEPVAKRFGTLESCPDDLLLFFHHVPYAHSLKSGKTVIQHLYDAHYAAARDAQQMAERWRSLRGRVDDERFAAVLGRLEYQAGHAQLWRDAVCNWFFHKSGIADNEGRVGNYPNRFEAESLAGDGYEPVNVTPWETASGGQCAHIVQPGNRGSIRLQHDGKAGWFDVAVRYFDENDGASKFRLLVGGQVVDEWTADDALPDNEPNGQTSARHRSSRIALRPGDEIRIEAEADGGERAAVDYVEIEPAGA